MGTTYYVYQLIRFGSSELQHTYSDYPLALLSGSQIQCVLTQYLWRLSRAAEVLAQCEKV